MQTSSPNVEWCWTVWPGLLVDEIQLENGIHLTPDVLRRHSVLWTRINTHSTEATAQVEEDEENTLIYQNKLGSLKKNKKYWMAYLYLLRNFIKFLLALILLVIILPSSYVELSRPHSALQNRSCHSYNTATKNRHRKY